MGVLMLTRRFLGTTVAALALVSATGTAHAAERALMGIVLGRSYRQVLAKFGSPDRVQAVVIPVPGQGNTGMPDQSQAGAPPGFGGPGGGPPGYGGPPGGGPAAGYGGGPGMSGGGSGGGPAGGSGGPSYGAPGGGPPGFGGAPGGSGGGPPVLPPTGGAPGAPGYGDNTGGAGATPGVLVGNGAEWIYNRPGGVTMAYVINEDGRVAQISVSSAKPFPAARTALGVSLGADFKRVLAAYGWPPFQYVGGSLVEAYYTKNHHASFTFVKGKLVRITIALAD
jgi:hypothetical protein